jgi:hypothetical protein
MYRLFDAPFLLIPNYTSNCWKKLVEDAGIKLARGVTVHFIENNSCK